MHRSMSQAVSDPACLPTENGGRRGGCNVLLVLRDGTGARIRPAADYHGRVT